MVSFFLEGRRSRHEIWRRGFFMSTFLFPFLRETSCRQRVSPGRDRNGISDLFSSSRVLPCGLICITLFSLLLLSSTRKNVCWQSLFFVPPLLFSLPSSNENTLFFPSRPPSHCSPSLFRIIMSFWLKTNTWFGAEQQVYYLGQFAVGLWWAAWVWASKAVDWDTMSSCKNNEIVKYYNLTYF